MTEKSKVWLIDGSRTPIGTFGRTLKNVSVDKLAGHVMKNVIRRTGINPSQVDGIILGHRGQSSYAPNTSRFSQLNAGLPASIPAMTVHRECGSGMQAVNDACDQIRLGRGDVYIAGGVESMSTVPYLTPGNIRFAKKFAQWFGLDKRYPLGFLSLMPKKTGPRLIIGFVDDGHVPLERYGDLKSTNMIGTAERVASVYGVTREESDAYSLRSHQLATAAVKSGRFDREIDPIQVGERGYFEKDEHPRSDTTIEKLASLKAASKSGSVVTAGSSSGINDGACAMLLTSEAKGKELGLNPLAVMVDHVVVGVDPEQMGIGPVLAIKQLLKQNNLTINDIDLFEINEAFAAQYLACEKLLGLDRNKVNVNGGAIALGHPIGMSGARVIFTLAHELKQRGLKRGIAALCIGGGQGIAALIEAP